MPESSRKQPTRILSLPGRGCWKEKSENLFITKHASNLRVISFSTVSYCITRLIALYLTDRK